MSQHDYAPFGFEVSNPYQDSVTKKFTGHERDGGDNPGTKYDLDYMHARYYSSWQSRFLSVDPLFGDIHRPQSLNRYSYVSNNPMNLVDPFGMAKWDPRQGAFTGDEITVTAQDPATFWDRMYWYTIARQEFGDLQPVESEVRLSAEEEVDFYVDLLEEKALGIGNFADNGPDLVLAYQMFGPQVAGNLDAIQSTGGTPLDLLIFGLAGKLVEGGGSVIVPVFKGYTNHGLAQAIARDGVGVRPGSILETLRSPLKVAVQSGGRVKLVGANSTVILNSQGRVITLWARNSGAWRITP